MTRRIGTYLIIPLSMLVIVLSFTNCDDLWDTANDVAEDAGLVDTYDENSTLANELSEVDTETTSSFISEDYDETDEENLPTYALTVPKTQESAFKAGAKILSLVGKDYQAIDNADLPLDNIIGKCYVDVKDYSYTMYFYGENSGSQKAKKLVCETLSGEWTNNEN